MTAVNQRNTPKEEEKSVFQNLKFLSENNKKDLLLFGDPRFDKNKNKIILEVTLTFIKKSERFIGFLFE